MMRPIQIVEKLSMIAKGLWLIMCEIVSHKIPVFMEEFKSIDNNRKITEMHILAVSLGIKFCEV